jgi:hypothetical protein
VPGPIFSTRFALNYWLTDRFAMGLFVTYLAARNATAQLSNGTSVPYMDHPKAC